MSDQLLQATVQQALELGNLCIMPPAQGGSKRPYASSWKKYQEQRPTSNEVKGWYDRELTGFGIICGSVSDNLEVLDFDERSIYEPYKSACVALGLGDLVERMEAGYLEHTPKGLHWLYRCEEIAGNTKLAGRPKTPEEMENENDKVKTLIETRGEGGYIIAAPSYGDVHPSGEPYTLVSGSLATIPVITPAERTELHRVARTFHIEAAEEAEKEYQRATAGSAGGSRPGDDFNSRADWVDILHGWTPIYERNGTVYLRRPGKTEGISGTVGWQGKDLFYAFTSSTAFDPETPYSKFGAYTQLYHAGDFKAAARELGKQGYGDQESYKRQEGQYSTGGGTNGSDPIPGAGWPDPMDLHALSRIEPHAPSFIMQDWLPCGYATLFAGHGGIGKSGIALSLAVCIALGEPFFGLPVQQRRVLYLSCEDRAKDLHYRLKGICSQMGVNISDLAGKLEILDLVGTDTILFRQGAEIAKTPAYLSLKAKVAEYGSEVLFVDGISDTYDGNENDRAKVKVYVNSLLAVIPAERGAAVLVGHVAKMTANTKTEEGYSGSTSWHNCVRARWYLYPEKDGQDVTGDLLLELQKSNKGKKGEVMRFVWNSDYDSFTGECVESMSNFDAKLKEREAQDLLLSELSRCKIEIPAARAGTKTTYSVLSAMENSPYKRDASTSSKKVFYHTLEQLRLKGCIKEVLIKREDRKYVNTLVVVTPMYTESRRCAETEEPVYAHPDNSGASTPCANAPNRQGGIRGECGANSQNPLQAKNDDDYAANEENKIPTLVIDDDDEIVFGEVAA